MLRPSRPAFWIPSPNIPLGFESRRLPSRTRHRSRSHAINSVKGERAMRRIRKSVICLKAAPPQNVGFTRPRGLRCAGAKSIPTTKDICLRPLRKRSGRSSGICWGASRRRCRRFRPHSRSPYVSRRRHPLAAALRYLRRRPRQPSALRPLPRGPEADPRSHPRALSLTEARREAGGAARRCRLVGAREARGASLPYPASSSPAPRTPQTPTPHHN